MFFLPVKIITKNTAACILHLDHYCSVKSRGGNRSQDIRFGNKTAFSHPCFYVVKILSDLAVTTIIKLNAINIVNGSLVHIFFRVESTEM